MQLLHLPALSTHVTQLLEQTVHAWLPSKKYPSPQDLQRAELEQVKHGRTHVVHVLPLR